MLSYTGTPDVACCHIRDTRCCMLSYTGTPDVACCHIRGHPVNPVDMNNNCCMLSCIDVACCHVRGHPVNPIYIACCHVRGHPVNPVDMNNNCCMLSCTGTPRQPHIYCILLFFIWHTGIQHHIRGLMSYHIVSYNA
jgi:hypothetical protein